MTEEVEDVMEDVIIITDEDVIGEDTKEVGMEEVDTREDGAGMNGTGIGLVAFGK